MTRKLHSKIGKRMGWNEREADRKQILSRQASRIRLQSIERTTRQQNQSHLGQGDETTWQLRSSKSQVHPQPTTEDIRRQCEGDALSKFDMRKEWIVGAESGSPGVVTRIEE